MTKGFAFVKDQLSKLEPRTKRYYVRDPKTPYLMLVIYPTGLKVFILNRTVHGKMKKLKIGRFDCLTISQAREKASDLNSIITLGGYPKNDKRHEKKALTLNQLYEQYYIQHAVKFTKRPEENKKTMEKHILPVFGYQIAETITSQQMEMTHTFIGEQVSKYSTVDEPKKSHGSANRILNIVSAVFNYGLKKGLISGKNPCLGIKRFRSKTRDRFLSPDELNKFMNALKNEVKIFSDFFKILLFTGARKSNVLTLEYSHINYNIFQWRISEKQTKNGEVNIISLSNEAVKILMAREMFNEFSQFPSKFVFPGDGKNGHLCDPKKSFQRIKQHMKTFDIRIHDLRRTLGSYMAINGASLLTIGKALNHKSQVSTLIYARLSQDPVLQVVNLVSNAISKINSPNALDHSLFR